MKNKKIVRQLMKIGNSEYLLVPKKIKEDLKLDEYVTMKIEGKKMIIEKLEIGAG
jgi:antitoxin component of MazEF toxin-antitoxin module